MQFQVLRRFLSSFPSFFTSSGGFLKDQLASSKRRQGVPVGEVQNRNPAQLFEPLIQDSIVKGTFARGSSIARPKRVNLISTPSPCSQTPPTPLRSRRLISQPPGPDTLKRSSEPLPPGKDHGQGQRDSNDPIYPKHARAPPPVRCEGEEGGAEQCLEQKLVSPC